MAFFIKDITVLMGKEDRESGKDNIIIVRKVQDERHITGVLCYSA